MRASLRPVTTLSGHRAVGGQIRKRPEPFERDHRCRGFALEQLGLAIHERVSTWAALDLRQRFRPVLEVTIWSTGEAELSTMRLTDDRVVNKHYEVAEQKDFGPAAR